MVTIEGAVRYDDDNPIPVSAAENPNKAFALQVTSSEFGQLMDVLERIQMQLALITRINFDPGDGGTG